MVGGGGKHDLARYRFVVQKTSQTLSRRPIAAESTQAGGALGHERGQETGPLFLSRSSPNAPKSIMPCIARSLGESSTFVGGTDSENHKNSQKIEVRMH
jgi:hypothetical protein